MFGELTGDTYIGNWQGTHIWGIDRGHLHEELTGDTYTGNDRGHIFGELIGDTYMRN